MQTVDLAKKDFKPSHIRRIKRVLAGLKPLNDDTTIQERQNIWQISFWIAGWRYYSGETVLSMLKQGTALKLERERSNPYNKDAVEVFTENGMKLGYVPDELCEAVAKQLDIGRVTAHVTRIRISDPIDKVLVYCRTE